WAGSIGFAFGAAVSYVNLRSLTRGVEGLGDRIVNRNSREKGGLIILRFVVRYGLVGAAAYAIFKSSPTAFRGFLWSVRADCSTRWRGSTDSSPIWPMRLSGIIPRSTCPT